MLIMDTSILASKDHQYSVRLVLILNPRKQQKGSVDPGTQKTRPCNTSSTHPGQPNAVRRHEAAKSPRKSLRARPDRTPSNSKSKTKDVRSSSCERRFSNFMATDDYSSLTRRLVQALIAAPRAQWSLKARIQYSICLGK